jgi:hypothetical protein
VATNCWVVCFAIPAVAGEITIELSAAPVTVNFALAERDWKEAEMVTLPPCNPVASPVFVPIAATLVSEELQVPDVVRVSVVPLL